MLASTIELHRVHIKSFVRLLYMSEWYRLILAYNLLTLSPPIPLSLYTLALWSNTLFLIFEIRALWRPGLSVRAPDCQNFKIVG